MCDTARFRTSVRFRTSDIPHTEYIWLGQETCKSCPDFRRVSGVRHIGRPKPVGRPKLRVTHMPHKVSRSLQSWTDFQRSTDVRHVGRPNPPDVRYLYHCLLPGIAHCAHRRHFGRPIYFGCPTFGLRTFELQRTSDICTTQVLQWPFQPLDYKYSLSPT